MKKLQKTLSNLHTAGRRKPHGTQTKRRKQSRGGLPETPHGATLQGRLRNSRRVQNTLLGRAPEGEREAMLRDGSGEAIHSSQTQRQSRAMFTATVDYLRKK
ncbi:hypothetical protein NPIL_177171 [Nephila pilipes]|uniref:Uncharacterized protein n=1 Tax=Nephila pilipes TaxID=299642 RepID=A0A8X6T5L8_NEPPI|nr:hypothetical protein NPIL_177171 [Nephila pilipes]